MNRFSLKMLVDVGGARLRARGTLLRVLFFGKHFHRFGVAARP
jgi:hypothetical protein